MKMFKKREKKTKVYELNDQSPIENTINFPHNNTDNNNDTNNNNNQSISLSHDFLNKKRTAPVLSSNPKGQFSTLATSNKQHKPNAHEETFFKSSLELKNTNTATREIEIDTDYQKDFQAIRERNSQISKDKLEGKIANNIYTGKSTSIIYAEKSERDLSRYKITGSLGPMRAPKNLRVNCRIDYAHGICKDYKETGYCGFGDSCVFLHDRGDYKTGCELEADWNREMRRKEKEKMERIRNGNNDEECNSDLDSDNNSNDKDKDTDKDKENCLCGLCKEEMIEPIVTNCSHYFCQSCAIKFYEKNHNCASCDKPTQGIFHNAEKIINHFKRNKRRKEAAMNETQDKIIHQKKINENNNDLNVANDNNENDGFTYLDTRNYATNDLFDDEDDNRNNISKSNAKVYFVKDNKKKKNKPKVQNDWLYISDYRSYD